MTDLPISEKERTMSESKQELDHRLVDLITDFGRNEYYMGQLSMCLQVTLAHEDKESPFTELAWRYRQRSKDEMDEMMEIIKELFPESGWRLIDGSYRADQKEEKVT